MSSTEKAIRCMPISFGLVGSVSIASGWMYSKSSICPRPSGVCSTAIRAWFPSSPTAVDAHSPLTSSRPTTDSPRSVKKAMVASRSRTAIPMFSRAMAMPAMLLRRQRPSFSAQATQYSANGRTSRRSGGMGLPQCTQMP